MYPKMSECPSARPSCATSPTSWPNSGLFEFDDAGMLNLVNDAEHPSFGPSYHWKPVSELMELTEDDISTPAWINQFPPFSTSKEYFWTALNETWPDSQRESIDRDANDGRRHIMEAMLASGPFNKSLYEDDTKETFVSRHNDSNFQNIMCDPTGHITGIIDWDKCRTVPRCFGYASVPLFLTYDLKPDYSSLSNIHLPWELEGY
jgi:hypothetical protein